MTTKSNFNDYRRMSPMESAKAEQEKIRLYKRLAQIATIESRLFTAIDQVHSIVEGGGISMQSDRRLHYLNRRINFLTTEYSRATI